MKLINHDKPYSWLQWPVTLKGVDLPSLHVTAKFFGSAQIDPEDVDISLNHRYPLNARYRDIVWVPVKFAPHIYVLELTEAPLAMQAFHNLFSLIKDDYPEYRPHITVPHDLWYKILTEELTPKDFNLTFGEIELWLGTPNE